MNSLLLKMLAKLTGAYDKTPESNIGKLFSIYAQSLKSVEDALQSIAIWRGIDHAKGTTLDRIGRNFGVARDGADDGFYRLMIKIKITALLSGGDVNTVIGAISTLFDVDSGYVELQEIYPAKIRLLVDELRIPDDYLQYADRIGPLVKRILAAGVGMDMYFRTYRRHEKTVHFLSGAAGYTETTLRPVQAQRTFRAAVYTHSAVMELADITIKPAGQGGI